MARQRPFTPSDLEAIRAATDEAERRTSAEIVTVIVERCDDYDGARWKAAAAGAMLAALAAALLHQALGWWGGSGVLWSAAPALVGAGAGFLLPRVVPALHRALIGEETLELRVERRAAVAFLQEEVFATRGRTGVLLFLALFERRAEVLCDSAVESLVPASSWEAILGRLGRGLREGRPREALVAAVEECAALLEASGLPLRAGDRDELADEPRVHED